MDENCSYRIEMRGKAEIQHLNEVSPLAISIARVEQDSTFFMIETDQSGLIGLLRHLHTRGVVFLSIYRERNKNYQEEK